LESTSSSEYEVRKNKIKELNDLGKIVYVDKFDKTHNTSEISKLELGTDVSIAGRIISKREFGKLVFFHVLDKAGKIQASVSINEFSKEELSFFKTLIDTADFIGIDGETYKTKRGELTIRVKSFKLLSKALRPLPEKWHGLSDVDSRFRQRYLDLISNEEVKDVFVKRAKIISFIRKFLEENNFVEVETPILQSVATGAAAKPFVTKHNTLDKDFFLRIAPEIYLKKVIAGGFEKVFEIGKNFRNEGMDASHLQEFTMLEWYAAYWNFEDNIEFVTKLIKELVYSINKDYKVKYQDYEFDFASEMKRVDYTKEINDLIDDSILDYDDLDKLKNKIKENDLLEDSDINKCFSIPALIDQLYKRKIRPFIIQPTILYNYPACLVPLARRNDKDNKIIDMFQLVIAGWEIVKAYSELIDPVIQRETFMEQAENKSKGDEEVMELDEDFLLAMEHGMPPMSGLGLGIDRLVAMLTNQETLRETVLFPQMK
jgi:lysyl-tRNA synthetase, class II